MFTILGNRRITGAELGAELGLHQRGISDFFDALVAMQFLGREGDGPSAKYHNTAVSALYLDSNSPRYIGGILVMLNARLFKFWNDLPEALRTGKPQNEVKHGQKGNIRGALRRTAETRTVHGRDDRTIPNQLRSVCRQVRFFKFQDPL